MCYVFFPNMCFKIQVLLNYTIEISGMYMIWWNDVYDVISRECEFYFACKVWVLRRGSNSMNYLFWKCGGSDKSP